MKKKFRTVVWLAVALLALAFLVCRIDGKTFKAAMGELSWSWAVGGVVLYFVAQGMLATRWVLLLRVHGVCISLFRQ